VLQRADLFVLRMIQDSYPARPVYFSRTSGGYARELGLGDFVLTQGLASKVFVPPKTAGKDTVFIQQDGYLDLPRTTKLWTDDFLGPRAMIKAGDWIDRPSVGIPYLYVATGMELSEILRSRGDLATANQVFQTSKSLADAVHLEGVVGTQAPALQQAPALTPGDSASGAQLPLRKKKP
jgi:hypothetical protein